MGALRPGASGGSRAGSVSLKAIFQPTRDGALSAGAFRQEPSLACQHAALRLFPDRDLRVGYAGDGRNHGGVADAQRSDRRRARGLLEPDGDDGGRRDPAAGAGRAGRLPVLPGLLRHPAAGARTQAGLGDGDVGGVSGLLSLCRRPAERDGRLARTGNGCALRTAGAA